VLEAAKRAGVEHYFVEQDEISGPPMQSIATSYRNLRAIFAKLA
jgi:hypothetical protein